MMSDYEKKMEELLWCPLCQHVLNEPRQLPCGHSLCLGCVADLGAASSGAPLRCPLCREEFRPTVELRKNYTLSSIVEYFQIRGNPQVLEVACDCCSEEGQPAVKSCLKCEVSLCHEHMKDHEQLLAFRGHPLVNAVPNLGKRKCPKHNDEVLRYYCEASRGYLCVVCAAESQDHFLAVCASMQQKLTESMNVEFLALRTQLKGCIKSVCKLRDIVQKKKKVTSLTYSSFTMAVLTLLLIVLFYAYHYSVENKTLQGTVYTQQKNMERFFSHFTEIFQSEPMKVQSLEAMDNEGFCKLDLDTAHNSLQVSNDLRTVKKVDPKTNYLSKAPRFTEAPQVMSIQCFSTGVHTWHVLAEGYWDIAVSYRSLDFKSKKGSTFGKNHKSWSLTHNITGELSAYHNNVKTPVAGSLQSNKIAVTVDIKRGNITFASLEPTVTPLHEFKAKLTEPVCLGLGLYQVGSASRATVLTAS